MKFLKRSFLTGLPIIATLGIVVWAFATLDGMLAGPQRWLFRQILGREMIIPGLGIFVILIATFVVGFLVSILVTNSMKRALTRWLERIPLVNMIFGALRDLFDAFAGDNKRFEHPVLAHPFAASDFAVMGFVTNDDLATLGFDNLVAVYLPQSYNFAGNLIMVPRSAITPISAPPGDVMKFILSGGVSTVQNPKITKEMIPTDPPPALPAPEKPVSSSRE